MKDDFEASDDDKKWEFFAGEFDFDIKGAYLMQVDISKCIDKDSDAKV